MKQTKIIIARLICVLAVFAGSIAAQTISTHRSIDSEPMFVDKPPVIISLPEAVYTDAARKAGAAGTVRASVLLSASGQPKNIIIEQGQGTLLSEAVIAAVQKMKFKPAEKDGKPVDVQIKVVYDFDLVFSETDSNVKKPIITNKPDPIYPASQKSSGLKDKVSLSILFSADGKLSVVGVNSSMPKEFDEAATEAAKNIKFTPAVHKKSKQNVSQVITVVYNFKP